MTMAIVEPTVDRAWPEPDFSVLRRDRRPPPKFPVGAFGPAWGDWIYETTEAAACPPDYVAAPLLAAASALIGNARWAQASPGWIEPPHLWLGVVGDSGNGKSPGADCLMRDVLPEIERRMLADFPDRLRDWGTRLELGKAAIERWRRELRDAAKRGALPPPRPWVLRSPEPQAPRLRQHDVTIEKVAQLLAHAAPKGLLIIRDELAGWIAGMNAYNAGGRAFWIEAYGGRPYRVERKSNPNQIIVPRLAVAVYGGTQPDRLARLLREGDDGLLARLLWLWPEPVPFRLGCRTPDTERAIRALDRLRELDLQPGDPLLPIRIPLTAEGRGIIETFAREMQQRQQGAGGLLAAAYGKARGQALRLALVLEMLWWCGEDGASPPPIKITPRAFAAAADMIGNYFMTTAERVYSGTATIQGRNAAVLARWILDARPPDVHIRHLQRQVRLPGLRSAEQIRAAADRLVAAGWLCAPAPKSRFGPRARLAYPVNPRLRFT
jgi:Protein of unknown function (DUF3987)